MPSHLRYSSSVEPISVHAVHSHTSPPAKKQKMSLTQTYYVASTARSKLGKEANRADHNLRRLVGHANLLDALMVELADAERQQEAWFNQSVAKAAKPEQPRHVQWIDTIAEELAEDEESDDDDASIYDEDEDMYDFPTRTIRAAPVVIDEDDDADLDNDDDEDDDEHALTRVASQHSPPELLLDSDSDSDDDLMPSSPEEPRFMELSAKDQQSIATNSFYAKPSMEDYLLQQPQQPVIAAC